MSEAQIREQEQVQVQHEKKGMTKQQRGVFIVCLLSSFFSPFMGSALNLSVPDISVDFNCGVTTVTWIVNAFVLTVAALAVPFGHLSDQTDRRRLMLIGLLGFCVSTLGCAVSFSITMLIIFRVLQSAFSAVIYSVNIPLLLANFPPQQRGRMLGYSVTSTYIALSLGPVLGGLLNSVFTWRSIFVVTVLLTVLLIYLAYRYIVREEHPQKICWDTWGNALYVLMISCLMLGLSVWTAGWWSKALVVLSLPLFVLFIRRELRFSHPVVEVRLFAQNIGYTLANIAALLNYGATFAISYTLSIFLQNVIGLSSSVAGLVLISQPVVMACVSPLAGRLSDRIAPYKLASAGMLLTAFGLFFLGQLHESLSLGAIIVAQAVIGFGFGFFSSPNSNAVLSFVDRSRYGEANSILSTMRTLGQSFSMVLVMFILGACVGNVVVTQAAPSALTYAINVVMRINCVVCLVGMVFSLIKHEKKPR